MRLTAKIELSDVVGSSSCKWWKTNISMLYIWKSTTATKKHFLHKLLFSVRPIHTYEQFPRTTYPSWFASFQTFRNTAFSSLWQPLFIKSPFINTFFLISRTNSVSFMPKIHFLTIGPAILCSKFISEFPHFHQNSMSIAIHQSKF